MESHGLVGVSALFVALLLASACKKDVSAGEGASPAVAPTASSAGVLPSPPEVASAPSGAALKGLDTCLVGNWKGTIFRLKTPQASAEGGANTTLRIAANGESVVDFGGMDPIVGKGAGAEFDFRYAGKATAMLSTPTQGAIASTKADMSGLTVSANVALPGAGKFPVLKNKSVAELAQMAGAIAGGKAPAAAGTPPGIDSNPLFSMTRYTCEGANLTLTGADGLAWVFTRAAQ